MRNSFILVIGVGDFFSQVSLMLVCNGTLLEVCLLSSGAGRRIDVFSTQLSEVNVLMVQIRRAVSSRRRCSDLGPGSCKLTHGRIENICCFFQGTVVQSRFCSCSSLFSGRAGVRCIKLLCQLL